MLYTKYTCSIWDLQVPYFSAKLTIYKEVLLSTFCKSLLSILAALKSVTTEGIGNKQLSALIILLTNHIYSNIWQ